jgi:hypothetical protein
VNVTVCYGSVCDECWTSRLQDVVRRLRGLERPGGSREVASCALRSGAASDRAASGPWLQGGGEAVARRVA